MPVVPDGVIVSGPTVWLDKYMWLAGLNYGSNASQRSYVDSLESGSSNAISLTSNASLAWIFSFLQFDEMPAPASETTEPQNGTAAEKDQTVWGDATGDGATDVADAVLLARFLTQDSEAVITDQGKQNANVIKGSLDSQDITALLMFIAKKIPFDQFPLESLPAFKD